jgi:hypothetical protein
VTDEEAAAALDASALTVATTEYAAADALASVRRYGRDQPRSQRTQNVVMLTTCTPRRLWPETGAATADETREARRANATVRNCMLAGVWEVGGVFKKLGSGAGLKEWR